MRDTFCQCDKRFLTRVIVFYDMWSGTLVPDSDDGDETVLECQNWHKCEKWVSWILLWNVATEQNFCRIMRCHDGIAITYKNHVFLTPVMICLYGYYFGALWRKKSNALINGWWFVKTSYSVHVLIVINVSLDEYFLTYIYLVVHYLSKPTVFVYCV